MASPKAADSSPLIKIRYFCFEFFDFKTSCIDDLVSELF
jgi:hypothetical protein